MKYRNIESDSSKIINIVHTINTGFKVAAGLDNKGNANTGHESFYYTWHGIIQNT